MIGFFVGFWLSGALWTMLVTWIGALQQPEIAARVDPAKFFLGIVFWPATVYNMVKQARDLLGPP